MQLFFITVSVLIVSANAKFYTDCGSKQATVQKVTVSGCAEDAKECVLKKKTNVTLVIDFTPNKEVKGVLPNVQEVAFQLRPYLHPLPDPCKDNGLTCPLPAGQLANYQITVPILHEYPRGRFVVKWELQDENEEDIVCIMIPVNIKK